MILFFDTETTGLVKDWKNKCDSRNPKLVQLGMVACDDNGRNLFTFGSLIQPYYPPETLTEGAVAAHGISYEMCEKYGLPVQYVIERFFSLVSRASTIVAHNIKFDEIVIMNARESNDDLPNKFCTMLESTNICCLPPNKFRKGQQYKWPKLSEVYKFMFNEDLVDAHDAMTDVLGCKRIYFELMKMRVAV